MKIISGKFFVKVMLVALATFAASVSADVVAVEKSNCPSGKDSDDGLFKVVALLKRRNDMSVEEFRDYYENQHAPLALRFIPKDKICRYFRRFVNRQVDVVTGEVQEPSYDSISEFWFASRQAYEEAMREMAKPEVQAVMDKDEAQLFDRSKMIILELEEYESVLSQSY